jgi:hypothetical protein
LLSQEGNLLFLGGVVFQGKERWLMKSLVKVENLIETIMTKDQKIQNVS